MESRSGNSLPEMVVSLHSNDIRHRVENASTDHRAIALQEQKDRLILKICLEKLIDIPTKALQGWIDKEIFEYVVQKKPELYHFNFKKDILPHYSVSGSMVQMMRYLVHQIEIGLRQALATNLILEAGHGDQLVYYYLYTLSPSEEDKEDYARFLPHRWVRAIFLCQKLADFHSIYLLSRNIARPDIKKYWWYCQDHFIADDRNLLEFLAATSHRKQREAFAFRLSAIFNKIKTTILTPTDH
jgi:hypothetical protein